MNLRKEEKDLATTKVVNTIVKYFLELKEDPDTPYPQEVNQMDQNRIDFEMSKLFDYILSNTKCTNPFIMDISEAEVIRLIHNPDDNISVSALLTLIDERVPRLQVKSRV